MRFFYKLGHILKLFSFFSFLTVNVIILIHFRIYEIQDNKSPNSEYAVREESWSSPSLRLFLEENSSWGQKQFKSICRLFLQTVSCASEDKISFYWNTWALSGSLRKRHSFKPKQPSYPLHSIKRKNHNTIHVVLFMCWIPCIHRNIMGNTKRTV